MTDETERFTHRRYVLFWGHSRYPAQGGYDIVGCCAQKNELPRLMIRAMADLDLPMYGGWAHVWDTEEGIMLDYTEIADQVTRDVSALISGNVMVTREES